MNPRWLLSMALLLGLLNPALAEEGVKESKASFWMQKKLEHSNQLLAALATEDFDSLAKHAQSLAALNQLEKWVRGNSPEYVNQLKMFQYANKQMINAANDENLDRATWAYMQMTLTCVNCHKLVREEYRKESRESQK